ncbi:Actin-dependent regulator of chromatin subfamily A [Armadillidium nasatum]|uniref:SWI/SNF-related matrix-associated actin-dependent regulator of chromatin subfamily A containing DEAD/H box 1 homolog n=1 Tax=Armadillidium nasatum TaxID=96803 RepID=A0A5N5TMW4_9CRUS|nr:Actin-dependent regulator of chromatin subfamily A [Armadillidium nasatum]
MDPSKSLRDFRKDKEKSQTSMLRYIRQSHDKPRMFLGSKNELSTSTNSVDSTVDTSGTSSSPNQLDTQNTVPQGSKLFYVKPLSSEEQKCNNFKESGFDMSQVLKSQNSLNGNHSDEDSNHADYTNNANKRLRIESDDDESYSGRVVKRPCLSDDENSLEETAKEENKTGKPKLDPEMIEKLLDTYSDLYPSIDRMELFDVMERWNYNFSEMTKSLDKMVKEKKIKEKERNRIMDLEEKRKARVEERERVRKQKQADMKKKKIIWKMKARFHEQEHDDEEEEDYIGKTKVYESDSSECEEQEQDEEVVTPARNMVLEFFNESPTSELGCLPGCSKKKADVIISLRPYENWRDLVYKFKTGKHISTDLLNSAKDVLQMRNAIKNLMKKCEKISSEIKTFVTDIITEDATSGMSEQPKILNPEMKLKNYQLIGLNWLVLMHDQQLNGVLADEMGLGKTVQAISFLAYLKEMGELEHKMCLIVVPTSTLDNWARELSIWLPSVGFLTYHGSQEERKGMRMDIFNDELGDDVGIILTTYNMVTSSPEDKALFKRLSLHTIIYDEAHMLKNMTSQRYENLMKIRCSRRLLLTGTPLQNNLVELMSILIFVMPQLFEGRKEELKKVFSMFPKSESEDSKGRYETERIQQAKRIMAPFFLRRLKEDVLKDLPTKSDEVFHVPMSERQEKMYNTTVQVLSKASRGDEGGTRENEAPRFRGIRRTPRNIYTDEKINEMAKILKKSTHKESILDYIIEDFSVMSDFDIHQTCVSLQNSIEEGMYQIACNKLQLERDVTGKNEDHRKGDVVALLKTALRVNNESIPE